MRGCSEAMCTFWTNCPEISVSFLSRTELKWNRNLAGVGSYQAPLHAEHCSPCLVLSFLKYEMLTYSAKLSFMDAYTSYSIYVPQNCSSYSNILCVSSEQVSVCPLPKSCLTPSSSLALCAACIMNKFHQYTWRIMTDQNYHFNLNMKLLLLVYCWHVWLGLKTIM